MPKPIGPAGRLQAGELVATGVEIAVVTLAVASVISADLNVLLAWEVVAVTYIVGGLATVARQSVSKRGFDRSGVLEPLSWILPLVSSVAGVYSAVVALVAQSSASRGDHDGTLAVLLAVIGIVVSWILLHVGMGQSYQTMRTDPAGISRFEFPGTDSPTLLDFLYFSFAIGAAFATSDTRVMSERSRLVVLVHSVIAFFYNALVVAVALQVLQAVIPFHR